MGQSEDCSKETFFRGKIGIPNRSPAKKRLLACQKQGKSQGNLPEVGSCCCARSYLHGWGNQEGTGPSALW